MQSTYALMNKNRKLLTFEFRPLSQGEARSDALENICAVELRREAEALPPGFSDINDWIKIRRAPKHRENMEELIKDCGCQMLEGFVKVTHALSLQDTYWIKRGDENLTWEQVSLFRNAFDPRAASIAFEGGTYGGSLRNVSPEFTTDGGYAKCWEREENGIVLMKRGSELMHNREPYSEKYASDIATLICRKSVRYDVIEYRRETVSRCPLFTDETTGFVPAWKLIRTDDPKEILDFMGKYGAEDDFRRMLVLDALIFNTDRHMGNYGMLFDTETTELLGMAPVFDHNMALLPGVSDKWIGDPRAATGLQPKIGIAFNDVAHEMLTPAIRADLKNLKGFRFSVDAKYCLSKERLAALERIINTQIDNILGRVVVPQLG